jgi:hypothetical protein
MEFYFTGKSLDLFNFTHEPLDFPPPSSSSEPLLHPCLLCSASFYRWCSSPSRRRAGRRRPPPASPSSTRHLLLEPDSVSRPAVLPYTCHGCRSSALSFCRSGRAHCRTPRPYLSRTLALPKLLHYVLLFLFLIPEPQLHFPLPPLLLSLRRPRLIVGSHGRPPTDPTDPLISFPDLCSSSPALSSPPILAGTRWSTIVVRHRPRLTVGSSLRAFPCHPNPTASTTSTT